MEETHGTEYEWKLNEFVPRIHPRLAVLCRDGNITRAEIIEGCHGSRTVDILAKEFLDSGTGSDGTVGEAGGELELLFEFVHDVPEAFGGVGGSGAVDLEGLAEGGLGGEDGGGRGAEEGGGGGAEVDHGQGLR